MKTHLFFNPNNIKTNKYMEEYLIQIFPDGDSPKIFRVRGTQEKARQQAVYFLAMGNGNCKKADIYSNWKSEDSFSQAVDTIYFDKNLKV